MIAGRPRTRDVRLPAETEARRRAGMAAKVAHAKAVLAWNATPVASRGERPVDPALANRPKRTAAQQPHSAPRSDPGGWR